MKVAVVVVPSKQGLVLLLEEVTAAEAACHIF
jgi:hypothetical protein